MNSINCTLQVENNVTISFSAGPRVLNVTDKYLAFQTDIPIIRKRLTRSVYSDKVAPADIGM